MKRSIDPNNARWIITGRCREPSAAVYSRPKRSGSKKSSWIVDICQVRPMASRAWTEIFGPVEGRAAGVRNQLEAGLDGDLVQGLGGGLPDLVGADGLLRVLGRQLEVEVVEAVVLQQVEDEGEQALELRPRPGRGSRRCARRPGSSRAPWSARGRRRTSRTGRRTRTRRGAAAAPGTTCPRARKIRQWKGQFIGFR